MKKSFILVFIAAINLYAAQWQMGQVSIVMPEKPNKFQLQAQKELEFHLRFVAGKLEPGKEFTMFIGTSPQGAPRVKADESIYIIDGKKIYFYGDDGSGKLAKRGSQLAIYTFFKKYFNMRYLRAGDDWVFGDKTAVIDLPEKETVHFTTPLELINLRNYGNQDASNGFAPEALRTTKAEARAASLRESLWRARMRLISRHKFKYGHAFINWQQRFLKTKPEYFGLNPYGKRGLPDHQASLVKLCLSNEAVVDQIIADWVKSGKPQYINLCPNDGTPGYCFCENCRKLDADLPGERFHHHKTDRYLNFWNRVLAKAVKIRPDVIGITYIYSYYLHKPRREKIQFPDNLLCGLVPGMHENVEQIFNDWRAAGMKRCFFRPNYTAYASSMPRGLHRFLYDTFKLAAGFEFIGADYDNIANRRNMDLEHYLLARLLGEPDAKYEDILNEYFSAYGKAATIAAEYYERLRIRGDRSRQATKTKMQKGNLSVLDDSQLDKYSVSGHTEQDLLADIEILKKGLNCKLSADEKKRLQELIICAEHYLHIYRFQYAVTRGKEMEKYANILTEFRIANKAILNDGFGKTYANEQKFWSKIDSYNRFVRKTNFVAADPTAGWRASFDLPGLMGWLPRKGFIRITDSAASFDKYSAELRPSAKNDEIGIWRNMVPVTPGKEYELSFDFKFTGDVKYAGLRVVSLSPARKTIARKVTTASSSHWIENKMSFKVPDGCTKIAIYIFMGKGSAESRIFADNIFLKRK